MAEKLYFLMALARLGCVLLSGSCKDSQVARPTAPPNVKHFLLDYEVGGGGTGGTSERVTISTERPTWKADVHRSQCTWMITPKGAIAAREIIAVRNVRTWRSDPISTTRPRHQVQVSLHIVIDSEKIDVVKYINTPAELGRDQDIRSLVGQIICKTIENDD